VLSFLVTEYLRLSFSNIRETVAWDSHHIAYKLVLFFLHSVARFVMAKYVEPVYNDIGLCDISSIASDILWYE
jgi:hypothetical protein